MGDVQYPLQTCRPTLLRFGDQLINLPSLESGPTVHLTLHGFIGPAARKLAVLIQNRDTAKKESQKWQCCIRLYIMPIRG